MTREEEGRAIQRSLERQDAFFRKENELERYGRCPEHPHEVRGKCPKCGHVEAVGKITKREPQGFHYRKASLADLKGASDAR